MSHLIMDVYRARLALGTIGPRVTRLIVGERAAEALFGQMAARCGHAATSAAAGPSVLWGLPVILDTARHPDSIACEYGDGSRVPVAELVAGTADPAREAG